MCRKIFSSAILVALVLLISGCAFAENLPSITMLSTKTCPACTQMEKVMKQLRSEYRGKVSTVHVYLEDNPDIAKKYNIRYVPTLIFRDGTGKMIAQQIGYRSLDDVLLTFAESGITFN